MLLTHAPPFAPRCVRTKTSWDAWAPHAGCKAAGDAIEEIMDDFPDCELLILSGHVHSSSCIQVSRNIEQRTASAQYGEPKIEEMIDLPAACLKGPGTAVRVCDSICFSPLWCRFFHLPTSRRQKHLCRHLESC